MLPRKLGRYLIFGVRGTKAHLPQLVAAVVLFATERTMNLEPTDSETAIELHLADRETEAAKATIDSHRSRLRFLSGGVTSEMSRT